VSVFFSAHAAADDAEDAVALALEQLGPLPEGANLGFVYATDAFAAELPSIVANLRQATGLSDWVGTVGLGVVATGNGFFDEPAISIMVASLPPDSFRIFSGLERGVAALLRTHGAWIATHRPHFGVVHADPLNPATPALVAQLADALPGYLVGGLVSSRTRHAQVAGSGAGAAEGGLSGVLFAESVAVRCGLSQGCSPIGPPRLVTEAKGAIIRTIDDRPAFDVLKEDLALAGEVDARSLHIALPVEGSDTADYLVRNLTGVDAERGWVGIGDQVQRGDRVMFCRRDARSAGEDLERMLKRLKSRKRAAPAAGLYFSCVARGPNLFEDASAEMEAIQQALGRFPLAGFFANGEISSSRLYGYTGVLALFE
jgi:small ligand-binding sensory domain FIST